MRISNKRIIDILLRDYIECPFITEMKLDRVKIYNLSNKVFMDNYIYPITEAYNRAKEDVIATNTDCCTMSLVVRFENWKFYLGFAVNNYKIVAFGVTSIIDVRSEDDFIDLNAELVYKNYTKLKSL